MLDSPTDSPGSLSHGVLRRALAIFLPASALLGCVVLVLYSHDLANEKALHEQAGEHLVDLQADIITRELKSVESDLLYLADQAVLRDFLSGGATRKQQLQDEYVLFCRQKALYDQIRYLDDSGQEVIRINYNNGRPSIVAEGELQLKAGRYYFKQAMLLDRGEVFISPFDLNIEHDEIEKPLKPVIRFASPVFDKGGVKQGVLILNFLGEALIRKLAVLSVNFPGSAMLLNQGGFFLRGPNPQDDWAFMFGNDHTFATYYPDEWESIRASERGQVETSNGLFTFRSLSPRLQVPVNRQARHAPNFDRSDPDASDAGLKVISHIPQKVLYGRSSQLLRRTLLVCGVALLLLLVLAWYLAYASTLRRNQERQIAESEARLRALSKQLITAQEDERRSLSRDLHDELGQLVTSVTLDLQRAAQSNDKEKKDELIARALSAGECLLERIHEISGRVRPAILDDLGLKDAVQSFLSEYEQRTGIIPRTDIRFEHDHVPAVVSENIYRILQEALTNVAKHAQVQEIFLQLHVGTAHVALTVRDEGTGFARAALDQQGLGILGMRERAELLDGKFVVKSEPGKGTEIQVMLPILRS